MLFRSAVAAASRGAQADQAGARREARTAAGTALQIAQSIVTKKPEIAASYAEFIAKDRSLLAAHATEPRH